MAKSEITKWFEDKLGYTAPKRPYDGAKKGPGWAYPVKKKKSIKRSMRWNKDIATSDEAKPVSPKLTPGRFKKWLAKHRNG